jgi:hypothetical protein
MGIRAERRTGARQQPLKLSFQLIAETHSGCYLNAVAARGMHVLQVPDGRPQTAG